MTITANFIQTVFPINLNMQLAALFSNNSHSYAHTVYIARNNVKYYENKNVTTRTLDFTFNAGDNMCIHIESVYFDGEGSQVVWHTMNFYPTVSYNKKGDCNFYFTMPNINQSLIITANW